MTSPLRNITLVALFAVAAFWIAAPTASADDAAEASARASVQSTIDRVEAILRDDSIEIDDKKNQVEELAETRFDFDVVTRLVLARNYRKFSDTQRNDFKDAFRQHLSATYRDTLDSYSDEKIAVKSARAENNGDVTVKTAVQIGADEVAVDYRMRRVDDDWLGIDVIVEGVSLVQNFRAQAQEIVSAEGPDALIEKLRAKVREES